MFMRSIFRKNKILLRNSEAGFLFFDNQFLEM
jgi:hypothetical protein